HHNSISHETFTTSTRCNPQGRRQGRRRSGSGLHWEPPTPQRPQPTAGTLQRTWASVLQQPSLAPYGIETLARYFVHAAEANLPHSHHQHTLPVPAHTRQRTVR